MKILITAALAIVLFIGCKSNKEAIVQEQNVVEKRDNRKGQEPPSIDEIYKLDSNNDGLLSKSEVKGPLERDFDKIDSNGDGFITREELEKAPKPEKGQRGQRPPRNN